MPSEEFRREIRFDAAYGERPKYGQHCVNIRWYLHGPKGVIQFVIYTGWYKGCIPTPTDWRFMQVDKAGIGEPMPADLGYHSLVPRYKGQDPMKPCLLLPQGYCYYDGSSLNAYRVFSIMVHEGDEAVWQELERYYHSTFDKVEIKETVTE